MELKFFGIGSCFNTSLGNNSAFYHDKDRNSLLMIDCGESIYERAKKYIENSESKIESLTVFITHTHSDHVGSLPSLIFDMFYCHGIVADIVCGAKVYEALSQLLSICGVGETLYSISIATSNEETIEETICAHSKPEELCMFAIETQHVQKDGIASYGVLAIIEQEVYFFSSDCTKVPLFVERNMNNIDYLILDCSSKHYDGRVHMSTYDLLHFIKNGLNRHESKIYVSHIDTTREEMIKHLDNFGLTKIKVAEVYDDKNS